MISLVEARTDSIAMGDELILQLVQQAAAGDAASMECLLLRYDSHLLRFVDRRLPQEMRRWVEPRDIIQDVHFEVFRGLGEFRATDIHGALQWLLRIARSRMVDTVRMYHAAKRDSRTMRQTTRASDRPITALLQELLVYERTPSRSAVAHELLRALQQSLERLPADYRQALHLRYMEGLSVEEAASRMSRTEGAVRMLCSRGLTQLRTDLHSMSFCV